MNVRSLTFPLRARRRLRSEEGVVALEAFFSIILVMTMTMMFWGVAVLLHNQTVLDGATQLAAQEGVIVYDRTSYREGDVTAAREAAEQAAFWVYDESSLWLIGDQYGVNLPFADKPVLEIACAPDYSAAFSPGACGTSNGRVARMSVDGSAPSSFFLLDIFSVATREQHDANLRSRGVSFSAGPCARRVGTC